MEKIPTLYVMIGPAGSGKTTYAKTIRAVHISPDNIREEMFGDAAIQDRPELVFHEAYERMLDALCAGKSVVFDATNTTTLARSNILRRVDAIQCRKIAVLMNTPLEEALRRNANRARKVPEGVIRRQYEKLEQSKSTIKDQFDATVTVE